MFVEDGSLWIETKDGDAHETYFEDLESHSI